MPQTEMTTTTTTSGASSAPSGVPPATGSANDYYITVYIERTNERLCYRERDHVVIWNREECRKISGNAAPHARNLEKYLAKYTACEVYNGQDLDAEGRPRLAEMKEGANGLGERVPIWNRTKRLRIAGNAAPLAKNLQAYLERNLDCELYTGQDQDSQGTSAAAQRRLPPAAAAAALAASRRRHRDAKNAHPPADEASVILLHDLSAHPELADAFADSPLVDTTAERDSDPAAVYRYVAPERRSAECDCEACVGSGDSASSAYDSQADDTPSEWAESTSMTCTSSDGDGDDGARVEGVLFGGIEEYRPVDGDFWRSPATLRATASGQSITLTSIPTADGLVLIVPPEALLPIAEEEGDGDAGTDGAACGDLVVQMDAAGAERLAPAKLPAAQRYLVVPGEGLAAAMAAKQRQRRRPSKRRRSSLASTGGDAVANTERDSKVQWDGAEQTRVAVGGRRPRDGVGIQDANHGDAQIAVGSETGASAQASRSDGVVQHQRADARYEHRTRRSPMRPPDWHPHGRSRSQSGCRHRHRRACRRSQRLSIGSDGGAGWHPVWNHWGNTAGDASDEHTLPLLTSPWRRRRARSADFGRAWRSRQDSDDDGDIVIDPHWWSWTGDPLAHDGDGGGSGGSGIPWAFTDEDLNFLSDASSATKTRRRRRASDDAHRDNASEADRKRAKSGSASAAATASPRSDGQCTSSRRSSHRAASLPDPESGMPSEYISVSRNSFVFNANSVRGI
ncbi:hypothetical protein CDCA_CDCA12G3426 [Cyanidium caldarium]|uniref:Uncharacterized protein n=1 Tax=Cyanidium caldarium TaxID=2771 RepID=A0AAV9IZC5_CYACA|nr:hypothetical protein CDCA_CDCA12G3426 [Cyanidium caldarium]